MTYKILQGDVIERLRELPAESVHCVVTSPPYWGLRDYGVKPRQWKAVAYTTLGGVVEVPEMECCLGLEPTPKAFVGHMVEVFREVRRVLRKDGTCWVNMGDAYASVASGPKRQQPHMDGRSYDGYLANGRVPAKKGTAAPEGFSKSKRIDRGSGRWGGGNNPAVGVIKPKDLIGQPWMLAFALRADGWWLRQDIIWAKPNPMPESVTDRCTKAHEYVFLLTKSATYYYDAEAIKEKVNGGAHARAPGNKSHKGTTAYEGGASEHRTKAGLVAYAERVRAAGVGPKASAEGSGTKYNESFSAAITDLVSTRNKRSVWEIATEPFPEAHFATFPTELVKPCILAGTSEKGCCEACGAPWERITEQCDTGAKQKMPDGMAVGNYAHGSILAEGRRKGEAGKPVTANRTTGWKATCACAAAVTPCTVLDPFNGSGTTGIVALTNRCNYIGVDLNPEYVAMAERRLAAATAQGVLL